MSEYSVFKTFRDYCMLSIFRENGIFQNSLILLNVGIVFGIMHISTYFWRKFLVFKFWDYQFLEAIAYL